MMIIIATIMFNMMSFGQFTINSYDNTKTNDNLEEHYTTSTFIKDTKILIEAIKNKKIEVKKTDYREVAKILRLEADDYGMTKSIEYDNDMMLNINCPVRTKFKHVRIINYQFAPVFDKKGIEYGHISLYLNTEFGKPKVTLNDSIVWEFNGQRITLKKDKDPLNLNFNIVIESLAKED